MIERLHGHHIPETGAECGVGVAVVVFPAARAVVGQAGAVAVGGIEGGDGVDHAVVRQPALVDVKAAGGVAVIVSAHLRRARVKQSPHSRRGGEAVAGRVRHGLVSGVGEIVDVRLDADVVVDLERAVDREVEEGVVIVREEVRVQHALERLREGLAVVLADAELVELEVVHTLEYGQTQRLGDRGGELGCDHRKVTAGLNERRTVVWCGDGGQ